MYKVTQIYKTILMKHNTSLHATFADV